jgi:hypothetical protein
MDGGRRQLRNATMRTVCCPAALALLVATSAFAQGTPAPRKAPGPPKDRGFISLGAGVQAMAGTLSDTFDYPLNAETASVEARYKQKTAPLFDGGVGVHLWKKKVGIMVSGSRSSASGTADIDAQIPHPFFDNQNRHVTGEAQGLTRTETAAHVDLYYLKTSGRWRLLLAAGPSYFNVEQETVTEVTVDEVYPYDTATFRGVTTRRGTGSAVGFNAAGDLGWMFSRSLGAGVLLRYQAGTVSVNADGGRDVSSDVGGLQASAGVRIRF